MKTIPACRRCRQRKSRCDTLLPSCAPCRNAGIDCVYIDPRTKEHFSRQHICDLESELRGLESLAFERGILNNTPLSQNNSASPNQITHDLSSLSGSNEAYNHETRGAQSPDSHFLGLSSGVHLARSVLEAVRLDGSVDPSAPYLQSQQPVNASTVRLGQSVPTPAIRPSKETAYGLIETYFSNCQVQYPILSQTNFQQDVLKLYELPNELSMDSEIKIRFCLYLVLAIALLFLSRDNSEALGLAENYYETAMQDLMAVMKQKDLATIQCLLLIFLYSFFNSTRAPMWYLAGLSMRLCVALGLHSEDTIHAPVDETTSIAESDEKRRIFWATYTLDRTLSIILGRPLSMRDSSISVNYPSGEERDLQYSQMIHLMRLQRLQSEIVSHLSIPRNSQSNIDNITVSLTWQETMQTALGTWRDEALHLIDSDLHTSDWWTYTYYTSILLLLRPALRIPQAQSPSLLPFYSSSIAIIQLSFIQQSTNTLSLAWTTVHHQFTAGITLLFVIWHSAEVRAQAIRDWTTVKSCVIQCGLVLEGLIGRWQSAVGAGEVLKRLAAITIEVLEREIRGGHSVGTQTRQAVLSSLVVDNMANGGVISGVFNIADNTVAGTQSEDTTMFPPMFGEDLTRSLYADPAEFYGFDYLNSGFLDEIDWSQTESPLNFHGGQINLAL